MMKFKQGFAPLPAERIHDVAVERKAGGWRYVQTLAVNKDGALDLIYSYMKDGVLDNLVVRDIARDTSVPSISDVYLEAFVFENEIHDLFGLSITDIAIDFGGNFYRLSCKEPMTVISPEQRAAREKARKIAQAKAAKEAKAAMANAANAEFLSSHPEAKPARKVDRILSGSGDAQMEAKLAGMDPEKVARVKAAMAAKAKKAAAEQAAAAEAAKRDELEAKLAGMDPEKAARVRAAMEAKEKRERAASLKEGE